MNKLCLLVLALAIMLGSASCKRHKLAKSLTDSTHIAQTDSLVKASYDSVKVVELKPEEIKVTIDEIDFNYLSSKSKVSFKSKDQNIDNATVNFRVKKDSIIWFTISQLGFTGARGLISRDSVQFLITIGDAKGYYVYTMPQLGKQFGIDLNFDLLQSLIVGNMPIKKRPKDKVSKEPDYYLLRQDEGKIKVENYIGENRKLKKLLMQEQPTNQSLQLEYEDFNILNNFLFPYSSLITLDAKSKEGQFYQTLIQIKHQKVELSDEPLTFPFSVPANYVKKN